MHYPAPCLITRNPLNPDPDLNSSTCTHNSPHISQCVAQAHTSLLVGVLQLTKKLELSDEPIPLFVGQ